MGKNNLRKVYIILFLVCSLVALFVFIIKNEVIGSVINPYKIYDLNEGAVEIEKSELSECCIFEEGGVEKVCSVLEGYSCDYCKECEGA